MAPLEATTTARTKFLVAGLMVSSEFQQCKLIVNKLHSCYPDKYDEPEIRAMLNVDWIEHLTKIRRQYGGDSWRLKVPAAVFVDGRFLGDNTTLINYISSTYTITLDEDFARLGALQLVEHFRQVTDLGRDFVSIVITKDSHKLGVLLVMLYTDLVPETCRFFLSRCREGLWKGTRMIRVVRRSWIQFRDANNPRIIMPCENYAVPHNRRGVLSMCNFRRHMLNSTDFHISLDSTPWMDYKYVGFGLVVQGEEVLAALEDAPASYEVPTDCLEISDTRQFIVGEPLLPDPQLPRPPATALEDIGSHESLQPSVKIAEEVESILDETRLKEGLYCKESDLSSHLPFVHLPERLLAYLKSREAEAEEEFQPVNDSPSSYTAWSVSQFDLLTRSKGFLVHSKENMLAMVRASELVTNDYSDKRTSQSLAFLQDTQDVVSVASSRDSKKKHSEHGGRSHINTPLLSRIPPERSFDHVKYKQWFYKKR